MFFFFLINLSSIFYCPEELIKGLPFWKHISLIICYNFCCKPLFICQVFVSLIVQTLEMLEKKEKLLGKKAAAEVEKAKQFTQSKNRNGEAPICSLFRFY